VLLQRLTQIKFAEIKELRNNPEGEKAQALFDLRDELVTTCNEIASEE
jgi:hypothetical protein